MFKTALVIILALFIIQEGISQVKNGFDLSNSSIPSAEIKSGGPPKDGIPALTNPKLLPAKDAKYLIPNDRVIGLEINNEYRAYPIKILNYHEIVNDIIASEPVIVSYCPLCGSALVFSGRFGKKQLNFGVSGLLFNSDVLMYDRETNSLWSQLLMEAVTGEMKGTKVNFLPSEQTTWKDWQMRHPETMVLSSETGHMREYSRSPYTGYEDVPTLYFPVSERNDKIFAKALVLGVEINEKYKAYPFAELEKANHPIEDTLDDVTFTISYDSKNKSAHIENSSEPLVDITMFWFAWYTFHPGTYVYKYDEN